MNRLPHIPLYLIETLLAISESTSLESAGKKLGLTQSTISKQMKLLESLLPHPLFISEGRQKVLTVFGKELCQILHPKISQTQNIIQDVCLQNEESDHFPIRIAGRGEFLDKIIQTINHPGTIQLLPMDNEQAMLALKNRNTEIAISHNVDNSFDYVKKYFLKNKMHILIPISAVKSENLEKDKKSIKPNKIREVLIQTPCVIYKQDDPLFIATLENWKIKESELKIKLIYPNYHQLKNRLIELGAWAIIPEHIHFEEDKFIQMNNKNLNATTREFFICYRKELTRNKHFLQFIRSMIN